MDLFIAVPPGPVFDKRGASGAIAERFKMHAAKRKFESPMTTVRNILAVSINK